MQVTLPLAFMCTGESRGSPYLSWKRGSCPGATFSRFARSASNGGGWRGRCWFSPPHIWTPLPVCRRRGETGRLQQKSHRRSPEIEHLIEELHPYGIFSRLFSHPSSSQNTQAPTYFLHYLFILHKNLSKCTTVFNYYSTLINLLLKLYSRIVYTNYRTM